MASRLCCPPPPPTRTLCQGPAQLGATRSFCDVWETLPSARMPLFGQKVMTFIENTYLPFFVHMLWEPYSQFWEGKTLKILTAILSRSDKVRQGHMN